MPRAVPQFLPLLGLFIAAEVVAAYKPPLPDPAEREAFQQQEMERHAEWANFFRPQASSPATLQDRYDVTYYRLALDLRDVDGEWIIGDLTARLVVTEGPLDSLLLDFRDEMQVDSILVNGLPAGYTAMMTDLMIFPDPPIGDGQTAEVRIYYQGHPREVGSYSFGWTIHAGVPIIWTLSEPYGAREWWPCKDSPHDKADSLDVFLRGPDWMVSTSNGLLVEETAHEDGSRTFHWKHRYPITTYLVSVTATNFERLEDQYVPPEGPPMLIEHFVYPELLAEAIEDFSITAAGIDAMAGYFGPYPFPAEKYGHALFPWGGAMEHQTNTSYGAGLVDGDHFFDFVLIHELAHQWWGDMTSPADWRDIWLNEGFASYGEALWFEYLGGFEWYRDYMVNSQPVYDPSGPIYDPEWLFDSNTVYNKGAWVLHMLRNVLGTDTFFAAFAEYRAQTEYRSTTIEEFQSIFEGVAGRDLDWFIQPWIYGINRPHYEVSFLPVNYERARGVAIHLEQTQTEWDFFPMPVELEIQLQSGGFVRERFWNDPAHLDVEFELPDAAVGVTVDPDSWILKDVAHAPYTLNITTTDLPDGIRGMAYEETLGGRGGLPPYTWSVAEGLPGGVELDPDTGYLHGVPADSGLFRFTVRVTDEMSAFDEQSYEWRVFGEPCELCNSDPESPLSLTAAPIPAFASVRFFPTSPVDEPITLTIYDLSGRRVRDLWNGPLPPVGSIPWDGRDAQGRKVASGVYLVRMQAASAGITRRVVWLR